MRRCLAALLALLAVLCAAPSALARTVTAHRGDVSASFTYTGNYVTIRDGALTISRGGKVLYSRRVSSAWCGSRCEPELISPHRPFLHVLPLAPAGHLDVVLDLFTGGAHCCSVEQVFFWDRGLGTYVKRERNFGDPGAALEDLGRDGRYEFLTADDSFAYEFTDFAASGLPIEIQDFAGGHFHGVTHDYPLLIADDASKWLRAYWADLRYHDTVGVIAAWAADEDSLGRSAEVSDFLDAQAAAGNLRSALIPTMKGYHFIAVLDAFLRRHGYLRS